MRTGHRQVEVPDKTVLKLGGDHPAKTVESSRQSRSLRVNWSPEKKGGIKEVTTVPQQVIDW